MTRGQYLSMCLIGAVAVVAYLNSIRLSLALQNVITPRPITPIGGGIL